MRRSSLLLSICLVFALAAPASAAGTFRLETADFTLTVPGLSDDEVTAETGAGTVSFYHTASRENGGGLIGTLVTVTPRCAVFSPAYTQPAYRIVAMGTDRAFLWRSPGGGVNCGPETLEDFVRAAEALSVEQLRRYLRPAKPDDLPVLRTERHLAYLTAEDGLVRPDDPLTRGELAEILYALLEADNQRSRYQGPFCNIPDEAQCQAASYLASYGMFTGYADGAFHPEAPVTRAQLAVLLHRCQFAPPVGLYGDTEPFADVPADHWAAGYIHSATVLGWMQGGSDGLFRPEAPVTRAQAVTAVNRMLGRDASQSPVGLGMSPWSDLTAGHWAYGNLLEAAGVLTDTLDAPFAPEADALPEAADASSFFSETGGWAVSGARLLRTADGGRTWTEAGSPLSVSVRALWAYSAEGAVLLGGGGDAPWTLLQTEDGGETWRDCWADPEVLAACLPVEQFGSARAAWSAVRSVELRPAGVNGAYLLVRYTPYDSVYTLDLTAVRQTFLSPAAPSAALTAAAVS